MRFFLQQNDFKNYFKLIFDETKFQGITENEDKNEKLLAKLVD